MSWRAIRVTASAIAALITLAGCASPPSDAAQNGVVHPELWPRGTSPVRRDPAIEAQIATLLATMSIEEKVGQVIQADMNSVTPEEVRRYRLGSVLNGGNSGPNGDDRAPAAQWLAMADAYYDASMVPPAGRPAVPILWGSDAVHGNANIIGATIFPHNIGLGATRDTELMGRIGEITALELRVVGGDWTFAPTIAVVRDDRWGRTYEGYGEEPRLVRAFAAAIVEGIQGRPADPDFLRGGHVLATAKHFLGDGGTDGGRDQGDNFYPERRLRDLFGAAYPAAIGAGVQTVMTSYNSWYGRKSSGNRALVNDVLVGRFGLDGFVVDDWNAHGQVPGCTPTSCAAAFNAGVDMFMAPDSWRGLYENTLAQVRSGEIARARLDEAVGRILRVKLRAGLMSAGRPSSRPFAGRWDLLGSPEHRAVARRAVRESLVLLKNDGNLLPLAANARVLVAGDGADDLSKQSGGWTISWQGDGNARSDFPHGQTIFEAVSEQVRAAGGLATLSVEGSYSERPDVAIVVFGENPYAEFRGDVETLDYQPGDARDLRLLQSLHAQGIPVVSVFLSGRPMYVTPELNASDAFIAAWLPGSEGGGVADLLLRDARGAVAHDFTGKLSFSWPRAPDQTPLNVGEPGYDPLFPFGYGLNYGHHRTLGLLAEASAIGPSDVARGAFFEAGRPLQGLKLSLTGEDGRTVDVDTPTAEAPGGGLSLARVDRVRQEEAVLASWNGESAARLSISGRQLDLTRQTESELALIALVRVDEAPTAPVLMGVGCAGERCRGAVDVARDLRAAHGAGWATISAPLSCLQRAGARMDSILEPFFIESRGRMRIAIAGIRISRVNTMSSCPSPQPQH